MSTVPDPWKLETVRFTGSGGAWLRLLLWMINVKTRPTAGHASGERKNITLFFVARRTKDGQVASIRWLSIPQAQTSSLAQCRFGLRRSSVRGPVGKHCGGDQWPVTHCILAPNRHLVSPPHLVSCHPVDVFFSFFVIIVTIVFLLFLFKISFFFHL
jgi:hypothetical protein